ncbi:MAG TPA: hypothetical protein HA362_02955, partial [Nanoarchaeota archaeon]|nr:hypothetical protein [Nanoarchaeota archaeon]
TWGNNGTCAAATDDCPNLTIGMRGKAYRFDGIDDYIQVPNSASTNISGTSITVTAWLKWNMLSAYGGTVVKTSNSGWGDGYGIYVHNDNTVKFFVNTYTNIASKAVTDDGNWHHVVGTYNGSSVRIWVDGTEGTPFALSGAITTTTGTLKIGAGDVGLTQDYNGSIDEVMIWNRALSTEEINASYNAKIYCYDNRTEILTEKGWKYFNNITFEDKVATLNATTGKTEFNTPTDIQDFAYKGEMYNVETENGDLLVSPEHKVYAKIENELPISPVMMGEVNDINSIPLNLIDENKTLEDMNSPLAFEVVHQGLELQGVLQNKSNFSAESLVKLGVFGASLSDFEAGFISIFENHSFQNSNRFAVLKGPFSSFFNFSAYSSLTSSASNGSQPMLSQNSSSSLDNSIPLINFSNISFFKASSLATSDQVTQAKLSSSALNDSSTAIDTLTIYNSPRAFILCNASSLFLMPSFITSGQFTSGLLSNLSLSHLGMDTVILAMVNASCVDIRKCVNIYKPSAPENMSEYKLVNVQESSEMLQNGSKLSFLDENLSKIEVKGISKKAYDGRVYDVTVPNHILLVRRNGLVTWSGNSLYRNFTSLSSGTYTYKAYVVDQAGNLNNTEERTFIVNAPPVVSSVLVNSTSGNNLTTDNLTAYVTASENDSDGYTLIYDWRKNGISDTMLNMPFDVNGSNGNTSNVKDYSSFGNNGTIGNGSETSHPIWNASCSVYSGSGGCYEFDGIDDGIRIGQSITTGNESTIEAWANVRTTAAGFRAIFSGNSGTNYCIFGFSATNILFRTDGGAGIGYDEFSTINSPITAGNWYHIVAIKNSTGKGIFVNGVLQASNSNTTAWTGLISNPRIGMRPVNDLRLNGSIDSLRIWNRSLSSSEVAMLYNNGAGLYNRTHSDATTNGDVWYVVVTPADKYEDGTPVASNNVTIAGSATSVTLTSPLDNWYTNSTAKFECLASSNIPLVNVSLWHNNTGTWARNATVATTASSAVAHYTVTGLTTNNFVWTCQACTAEGCTYSTINRTLVIDIVNPDISFHSSSVENATKRATYYNNAYINTTITETSNNYSAFIDWNRSLVGYWRLENDNGTFFEDSSTWGKNGTCTTTACPNLTTGMRGKAYDFDGSNDAVIITSPPNPTTAGTLEAWVKVDGWGTNYDAVIFKGIGPSWGQIDYGLFRQSTTSTFIGTISDGTNSLGSSQEIASSAITPGNWYHLAFTWNSSVVKFYTNGLQTDSGNWAYTANGTRASTMDIGFDTEETYYPFNGSIDEVKIWNRALSPEEINASYSAGVWKLYHNFTSLSSGTYTYKAYVVDQAGNLNNTEQRTFIINTVPTHANPTLSTDSGNNLDSDNITASNTSTADIDGDAVTNIWNWYRNGASSTVLSLPFEGGSTSSFSRDYSGFGNNVSSAVGSPVWGATSGYQNTGGYSMNGSDYLIIPDSDSLNLSTNNFTITAWVKVPNNPVSSASPRFIFNKGSGVGRIWVYLGANTNILAANTYFGGGDDFYATSNGTAINNSAWRFIAFVVNRRGYELLYQDGVLAGMANISNASAISVDAATQIQVGISQSTSGTYFNGTIDDMRLYNMSLTSGQVLALYQNKTNVIHSSLTSAGETWSACVTPNDGQDDGSTLCTNTNITINTPPPKVTLAEPTHGNKTMTNRSVSFRWLAVADADGDTVTYNLSISCYSTAGGSCSPSDDRAYSATGTTYNLTEATELHYLWDDNYYYNWSVTAYDGYVYGEASNQSNFSISSEVILSMVNDTVNFGDLSINDMSNTTNRAPAPMQIENRGNVLTTVNLSYATSLFAAAGPMPNSYYRIRVNNTPGYISAFNATGSQVSWADVPQVNQTLFNMLNYSTGNDRGDIHIHVQVPDDEPSGDKSSILTITGWYAG